MSAGSFVQTVYGSDNESNHLIRAQIETLAMQVGGVANQGDAGSINSPFAAETSRGSRAYGMKPRMIRVGFGASPPDGYQPYSVLSLPIFRKDFFEDISPGDVVTYSGATGAVLSKVAENIRPGYAVVQGQNLNPNP